LAAADRDRRERFDGTRIVGTLQLISQDHRHGRASGQRSALSR
jgi:hypothetical protein